MISGLLLLSLSLAVHRKVLMRGWIDEVDSDDGSDDGGGHMEHGAPGLG